MIIHSGHPTIRAFCFNKDLKHHARFDALQFFSIASEDAIAELVHNEWGLSSMAFCQVATLVSACDGFPAVTAVCAHAEAGGPLSRADIFVRVFGPDAIAWLTENRPEAWARISHGWQQRHELVVESADQPIMKALGMMMDRARSNTKHSILFEQSGPDIPFWDTPKYLQRLPGGYETYSQGAKIITPLEFRDEQLVQAFMFASELFNSSDEIDRRSFKQGLTTKLPDLFSQVGDDLEPQNSFLACDKTLRKRLVEAFPYSASNVSFKRALMKTWDLYVWFRVHCHFAENIMFRADIHQVIWSTAGALKMPPMERPSTLVVAKLVAAIEGNCLESDETPGCEAEDDEDAARLCAEGIAKDNEFLAKLNAHGQEILDKLTAEAKANGPSVPKKGKRSE